MTAILSLALLAATSGTPALQEVSVWRSVALTDEGTGWVVTEDKIVVYAGPSPEQSNEAASFTTPYAATILEAFGPFATYDGQALSCNRMKDGWTLTLRAAGADGQFTLSATTPSMCTDGPAHELWQAYKRLTEATHVAP